MINLTKDIIFIKSGEDLEKSIKTAITNAKKCICRELFDTGHISPSKVTTSARNKYYAASIVRLFDDHLSIEHAPTYDEAWVHTTHKCTKQTPDIKSAKEIVPVTAHDWLNKGSLERLSKDCVLVLHFLWQEKAILLPLDMKKPLTGSTALNSLSFEVAAESYTEVLALVRSPFVSHISHKKIPDITTVLAPSAIGNFERNAWRMVRSTDWHNIEDIDSRDISALIEKLLLVRQGKSNWFRYPLSPNAFLTCIKRLYPDRCKNIDLQVPIKNAVQANRNALISGEFAYPEEYQQAVDFWVTYQEKYISRLIIRGMKSHINYSKSFAVFNTYLFSELPVSSGLVPPMPKEFNRRHIDGHGFKGLITYLHETKTRGMVKICLYHINAFFDFLSANSTTDENLFGFVNPILAIDYPIVSGNSSSTKPAFGSEHFPHLLQFCYAIESFATLLAEKVFEEQENLYDPKFRADIERDFWRDAHRVVQTEKFGYVPIVFYCNPKFDRTQPKSKSNNSMSYEPLLLLPRVLFPIVENIGKWAHYPQLNYIRHNIIALETGLRAIHIRWLEQRTYDKHIDRSRLLPPICKLHVSTDKANDPWDATVSKNVIDILDRQKKTIAMIGDAAMGTEVWYDNHEQSRFGKIIPMFPRGGTPGVLGAETYAKYFRRLIYFFDVFCKFQLGINTTNPMPEEMLDIDSINDIKDYFAVLKLESKASNLIEHTPHSCRVSVVSAYIRLLPPHIIGAFITGQATEEHVIYYAKLDPAYLKTVAAHQKMSVEHGWLMDRPAMSSIKAEDIASKLQQAFRRDKEKSMIDFGAISFERESKDEITSGLKAAKQRPIDSLAFMPTHICPFGNWCPVDVIKDLGAVPGSRTPCGGCYYSIKTVDHLPRIHGHIRVLTDECNELESYISEAKKNGAAPESLAQKANHRKFLASEVISWSVTVHCLEQMYSEIRTRSNFLIEKPEIVSEHLERLEFKDNSLSNLIARTAEAKSHAEYFTPQLSNQIRGARNKLLAFTSDFNRMLQETPTGFTLIDEFRGLIRSACEVLSLSVEDLSKAMNSPMSLERPNAIRGLISKPEGWPHE